MNIGIVGTGVMGCTVARRFLENGHTVYGYDAFPACVERGRALGVRMCLSLAELAAAAGHIILFLPGPPQIEECVCGSNGLLAAMPAGSVIIDMSTSAPDTTRLMHARAEEKGVHYLDAPVLGRPVTVGTWALPVGGDATALESCMPFFTQIAAHVRHMGGPGSGHTVKLLNQLMFGAINAMTAEMMAISEKMGLAPERLYEVITASQAGTVSNLFKELGKRVSEERYDDPVFTVALLNKDVQLAVRMAEQASAPPLLGRTVDYMNRTSLAQGYGAWDTSIMWKSVRNCWKEQGE